MLSKETICLSGIPKAFVCLRIFYILKEIEETGEKKNEKMIKYNVKDEYLGMKMVFFSLIFYV
jgi:hypothetical protein